MSNTVENGNIKPRIRFIADGNISEFLFNFTIFENENLDVYLDDKLISNGITIQQNADGTGGSVIFDTPPQQGKIVTLIRNLEFKRTSDFQESGAFRAKVINHELDYQVASLQQLDEKIGRTVTFPPYAPTQLNVSLPMPEAGKAIVWNADGNSLENSTVPINEVIAHIDTSLSNCDEQVEKAKNYAQATVEYALMSSSESATAAQHAQNAATCADSAQSAVELVDSKIAELNPMFQQKLDVSLSNISNASKKLISNMVMPNFNAGISRASGQTFQADTDGWLWIQGKAVHGDSYGYIGNSSSNVNKLIYRTEYSAGHWSNLNMTFTPLPKGWYYRTEGNFDQVAFYPCLA